MFDPDRLPELRRLVRESTHGDASLLEEVLRQVMSLRPVQTIQPRNSNSVSLVASDGGNNRLEFNPFSLMVVRVVDTYGVEQFLDVISPHTDTAALGQRHLDQFTPLGKMMLDLGVSSLSDLSPMISERRKPASWPLVYRDLCEWAVLYDLICNSTWGSDTLIIHDGLLRAKIFAKDLFIVLYGKLREAIERTRRERRRDIFLVGIAKHSRVIERYRLAMAIADVFPAGHPRYVAVPAELQGNVYGTWPEYIRSPGDDSGDMEKPKFNMGAMHLARFGKMSADPVWTVDLLEFQASRAQQIFGSLVSDAEQGFPIPWYPQSLQAADRHAQVVDLDLAILRRALEDAVREQVPSARRAIFDAQVLSSADPASVRYQ
ncbi:MAG TPA: hypothetical protein VHZ03_34620 [Trebonia sp.]|jgi:hypothetical protein|nr:hypothetical protein [Trebonia sp.]